MFRFTRLVITLVSTIAATAFAFPASRVSSMADTGSSPHTGLQQNWAARVVSSPTLIHATVSAYAYDLTQHKVLAAIHADWRQTPASVTKLITSAAALDVLGPHFQYRTTVNVPVQSHEPGPIYLVGGGDPLLEANRTTTLEVMARQVAHSVKSATRVIGVTSLFPSPIYGLGWSLSDVTADYGAGTAALMAERSEIEVRVHGTSAGQRPNVALVFNSFAGVSEYFHVENQALTVHYGAQAALSVTRQIGTNHLIVSGSISEGETDEQFLSIGNPAGYAAVLFQSLLAKDGVAFRSGACTGTLPRGTRPLVTHHSDELAKSLKLQNQYSINQMAENLYRMIGEKAFGSGSSEAASRAMHVFLQKTGVDLHGMQMVDGSGLSPLDDMSAKQVVQVLRYASTRPWFISYEHSLMELNSSVDGGVLTGHHFDLPAGTQVWLKTGNLSNQWNYAGYVHAANGDRIAFAILDDGPKTGENNRVGSPLDQMVVDMAKWPNEPVAPATNPIEGNWAGPNSLPVKLSFLAPKIANVTAGDGILGISVVDATTGRTVWGLNGSTILPAGLLPRLAVEDVALMQPGLRFGNVTVRAHGIVRNGRLDGWLTINADGVPTLTESSLKQLAEQVSAEGIRSSTGRLRYVSTQPLVPWPQAMAWNDTGLAFAPPWSSLSVDGDIVHLRLESSTTGRAPVIAVSPSDAPISVSNLVTSSSARPTHVSVSYDVRTFTYTLTGNVKPGAHTSVSVAPGNAGQLAAIRFRDALMKASVAVPAGVVPVTGAPGKQVGQLAGPTPATVVTDVLNPASSSAVGQLYRLLGAHADKQIQGLLGTDNSLQDPTALGIENYVEPHSIARLLFRMMHQPKAAVLRQALSAHLWNTSAPEVQTLAGFVRSPDGRMYGVVVIHSNLLWNGSNAPTVYP